MTPPTKFDVEALPDGEGFLVHLVPNRWAVILTAGDGQLFESGIEIRHWSLGWQVWFEGAPASEYLETKEQAVEEAKVLYAEEALSPSPRGKRWNRKRLSRDPNWKKDYPW